MHDFYERAGNFAFVQWLSTTIYLLLQACVLKNKHVSAFQAVKHLKDEHLRLQKALAGIQAGEMFLNCYCCTCLPFAKRYWT